MAMGGKSVSPKLDSTQVIEPKPDPATTLADYLRNSLGLRGAKLGCNTGGCGSCTVMLSHYDRESNTIINKSVVSCLVPLCAVHGYAVVTVEGIGSKRTGLHEIQKRLVEAHGIQCGFCTPGMVMSMYCLLRSKKVTKENIEKALEGNLCRCTGYRPIVEAFQTFEGDFTCGLGDQCCRNKQPSNGPQEDRVDKNTSTEADPSQEPIFPSELQVSELYLNPTEFVGKNGTWIYATNLDTALKMKRKYPSAIMSAGSTQTVFSTRGDNPSTIISLMNVKEMRKTVKDTGRIVLGAALTVTEAIEDLKTSVDSDSGTNDGCLQAVLNLLERFGSEQIRNMSTLGGSLHADTANSDVVVGLMASDALLTLVDMDGNQTKCKMVELVKEGKYTPPSDTLVLDIEIPFNTPGRYVFTGKQSSRRGFDRALVNVGFSALFAPGSKEVKDAVLCFGGIGSSVIIATTSSKAMSGRLWNEDLLENISQTLCTELVNWTEGKNEYKQAIALGFVMKFYNFVREKQMGKLEDTSCSVPCNSIPISGIQVYEEVSPEQRAEDTIGRPLPNVFTQEMATGEALYYSDLPGRSDEKFLAMVYSSRAHAKVLKVDMSEALEMDGVFGYIDHKDVPGSNMCSGNKCDLVLAVDEVIYVGQAICGILANDEKIARKAVKAVKVTYEELPSVLSISDAIEKESFFDDTEMYISRGNFEEVFKSAGNTITGTSRSSAQEHFYMEPQCAIVIPSGEQNEYNVYAGTQAISFAHDDLSAVLGISRNRIIIHTKRTGGAFGGKEGRTTNTTVILPAAIAAYKYQVPVRATLTREDDIMITNKRHPVLVNYKASFTSDGLVESVRQDFYGNGGAVLDNSKILGEYILPNADSCYKMPHYYGTYQVCKTNRPTPGAMRGFGQPQSTFHCEDLIDNIADSLGILPEQLREKNLLENGHTTFTGVKIDDWTMKDLWKRLKDQVNVEVLREEIKQFNSKNQWKKRGMAMVPMKFSIGFPFLFLNQGSALVMVYTDGSVMLAHGGIEMGQGLHSKMIQVASRELGIPVNRIHTSENGSNTIPECATTGGSQGSDVNGPAIIEACKKILARLEPFKKANPTMTWDDLIMEAYTAQVSLTATGHIGFDDIKKPYEGRTRQGNNTRYYTTGVACTQVELDSLTGEHVVLKTDILIDVGRSLNPGIDIGQIEGAFIQGLGMVTTEELLWTPEGDMISKHPGVYKIPTVADIPRQMNVTLAKSGECKKCVYSARGIGEPALLLGSSVFFAIKDAIKVVRRENGIEGRFRLDCPATVERIKMACADKYTKMVIGDNSESYAPEWNQ